MEEAISHVPATTEPAAENHARVSESSPAVDAGNTVPPQEPPEPPHESPAPAAVQPQAASSDADGPKGKKPNVFRRAITRIFGRRDKHAVSTPVKPE
jgi:uncharacterized membrane protein